MEELIKEIQQKYNIKNLRIIEATYNKKLQSLFITFLTDENLDASIKDEIIKLCKSKIIDKTTVKFTRNIVDEYVIKHFIKEFLTINYKTFAMLFDFKNVDIKLNLKQNQGAVREGDREDEAHESAISGIPAHSINPTITFTLTQELFEIFVGTCKQPLLKYLNEQFFAEFFITEKLIEDTTDADSILNSRLKKLYTEQKSDTDKMLFNDVCDLIGVNKSKVAIPIKHLRGDMQDINVCGTISFFKERTFKKEKKGVEVEKKFYTFTLNDGTGKISVTIFATKAYQTKLIKLCDQTKVLIYGYTEIYNERLSLRVKSLALVGDYKLKKADVVFKAVPSDYKLVKPKKYENYTQINWFDESKDVEVDEFLINNEIVVFDIETTGLNPLSEKIIEIGAVRLVKGKLVEYFSTYVNPKRPLPTKIVNLTGITDRDLVDAPTIDQVIGDFYKFCNNTILIAYNAEFDIGFIKNESKPYNYYFDNKVLDAMDLVYKSGISVANFKLKSALASLGIENKGAHRAFNDAEATAELVIKLGKYLKDI